MGLVSHAKRLAGKGVRMSQPVADLDGIERLRSGIERLSSDTPALKKRMDRLKALMVVHE